MKTIKASNGAIKTTDKPIGNIFSDTLSKMYVHQLNLLADWYKNSTGLATPDKKNDIANHTNFFWWWPKPGKTNEHSNELAGMNGKTQTCNQQQKLPYDWTVEVKQRGTEWMNLNKQYIGMLTEQMEFSEKMRDIIYAAYYKQLRIATETNRIVMEQLNHQYNRVQGQRWSLWLLATKAFLKKMP